MTEKEWRSTATYQRLTLFADTPPKPYQSECDHEWEDCRAVCRKCGVTKYRLEAFPEGAR